MRERDQSLFFLFNLNGCMSWTPTALPQWRIGESCVPALPADRADHPIIASPLLSLLLVALPLSPLSQLHRSSHDVPDPASYRSSFQPERRQPPGSTSHCHLEPPKAHQGHNNPQ